MECLPDELWAKILGVGVEKQVLDYRDLCSLAFVCRRIRRISSLDCMWRLLWERDQGELGGGSATRSAGAELGSPRKHDEMKSFRELYRMRLVFFLMVGCWSACWDSHCSIGLRDIPCDLLCSRRHLLRLFFIRYVYETICASRVSFVVSEG